jgi:YggT family protein
VTIGGILSLLITALIVLIFVRIVLSWFPPGGDLLNGAQRVTFTATEWLLGPIRRVLPPVRLGGAQLDLSPMIVLFVLFFLQPIVGRL